MPIHSRYTPRALGEQEESLQREPPPVCSPLLIREPIVPQNASPNRTTEPTRVPPAKNARIPAAAMKISTQDLIPPRTHATLGGAMEDLLELGTCFEVDDAVIERVLSPVTSIEDALPRERVFALLDRMAQVAKPRQGGSRVLQVLARLASCEWLEGNLEVWLTASDQGTQIELLVDDGMLLSRLRSSLALDVPFEEMEQSVPKLESNIMPLRIREHDAGKRMVLVVDYGAGVSIPPEEALATRPTTRPPASIAAIGMQRAARRSERPACKPKEGAASTSSFKDGWGRPPEQKPTVKMHAIRIPPEAYRDPEDAPVEDQPADDTPTIKPPAPPTIPGADEGSPRTDGIDEGW